MEIKGTRWSGCQRKNSGILSRIKTFGLSSEDARDKDNWRIRIKGQYANRGFPGK